MPHRMRLSPWMIAPAQLELPPKTMHLWWACLDEPLWHSREPRIFAYTQLPADCETKKAGQDTTKTRPGKLSLIGDTDQYPPVTIFLQGFFTLLAPRACDCLSAIGDKQSYSLRREVAGRWQVRICRTTTYGRCQGTSSHLARKLLFLSTTQVNDVKTVAAR
jgi:hypothetical protein